MNKQLLDLFKLKLKKPQATQRELAKQLNISLGKVKRLREKSILKTTIRNRQSF